MRPSPIRAVALTFITAITLANEMHTHTSPSGGLNGVVTNQSDAVMPDAAVQIKETDKGILQATKPDGTGYIDFSSLPMEDTG